MKTRSGDDMMINGKQLTGLCRVLNVFQSAARMDCPIVVDDAHVMMCEVKQTPMFGIDSEHGLDVEKILKMKIENEDFDVSIENLRYILKNENHTYSFSIVDENSLPTYKAPKFGKMDGTIETDAKTLLKAVKKCLLVSEYCIIQDGRMSAKDDVTDVSFVLGKDNGSGCRSLFSLNYLKKIAKVMTGDVKIYFGNDCPLKMCWCDGFYDYTAMLAQRVENWDRGQRND